MKSNLLESIELIISKEGDFKQWVYECDNGLKFLCKIRRSDLKFLCGYVCLTSDNDFYNNTKHLKSEINAHGGLTYIKMEDDMLVVGFDCAHYKDIIPNSLFTISDESTYRDMVFATNQCNDIAEQISKISKIQLRNLKLTEILE